MLPSRTALALALALTGVACGNDVGPGGSGQLAFVRYTADGSQFEIYRTDVFGAAVLNLTRGAGLDWIPAWSPDGRRIVFSSSRGAGNEIYVMNADGSAVTRLTDLVGPALCHEQSATDLPLPGLVADAAHIAFVSPDLSGADEVFLIDANGGGETDWSNNPGRLDDEPAWSPDGRQIAFFSDRDGVGGIYVMNVDGTGLAPLITTPGVNRCPSWSPNGHMIAFTSSRDGTDQIYVANADGTAQRRVTDSPEFDVCPRWRP